MRTSTFVAMLLPFALGCGAAVLTPGGAEVRLMKADPPGRCKDVGTITGQGFGDDDENAKIAMRNAAAKRGANYVRLDSVEPSDSGPTRYAGTAFDCPGVR